MIRDLAHEQLAGIAYDSVPADIDLVLVAAAPGAADFTSIVTEPIVNLASALRSSISDESVTACLVVVGAPTSADAWTHARYEALMAAAKGLVQSATLELSPQRRFACITVDIADLESVGDTISFLAGPLGGFVRGAGVVLRAAHR